MEVEQLEQATLNAEITKLENQILALPKGSISTKKINGSVYYYHRWSEGGKRTEKYVPAEEVETLREQIEKRKALEQNIKALRKELPRKRNLKR
jgi:hypothetical protein